MKTLSASILSLSDAFFLSCWLSNLQLESPATFVRKLTHSRTHSSLVAPRRFPRAHKPQQAYVTLLALVEAAQKPAKSIFEQQCCRRNLKPTQARSGYKTLRPPLELGNALRKPVQSCKTSFRMRNLATWRHELRFGKPSLDFLRGKLITTSWPEFEVN